jgi:hypothetical protein
VLDVACRGYTLPLTPGIAFKMFRISTGIIIYLIPFSFFNQSKLRLLVNGAYKDIGGLTDVPIFQRTRGELSRISYEDGIQKRLTREQTGDLTITFNYSPKDRPQRIIEGLTKPVAENNLENSPLTAIVIVVETKLMFGVSVEWLFSAPSKRLVVP